MDGAPCLTSVRNPFSGDAALRRISSPIEVSDSYLAVTRDNAALDLTAEIFGPNIKLVATKANLKLQDRERRSNIIRISPLNHIQTTML